MMWLKAFCLFIGLTLFCVGCEAIGFMQDTVDINRGTLVVTAGTNVAEMKKRSTFDLGAGSKHRATDTRVFTKSARFDWQLPGTNLTFKDCSNYFLTTDKKGETIEDIQVITAQKYLMWDEVKVEMYEIEKRLLADGWKSVRYRDGTTTSEYLKQQLEKPKLSNLEDTFGGATYGKGKVFITLLGKRPPIEEGEDPYKSDKFTHYVHVETRANRQTSLGDIGVLPE